MCLCGSCLDAATPVHVFSAAGQNNLQDGSLVVRWEDDGPGFAYTGQLANIDLNSVSGIHESEGFVTLATRFTRSYRSEGLVTAGAKPQGQPQSSSIGNGLADGSVEIWFRTDLEDGDRPFWQVIWESGG